MALAWNQADLDLLKRLVEGGQMTFGQMTREFPGRSRNALIGKAQREGFRQPPLPTEPGTVKERKPRTRREPKAASLPARAATPQYERAPAPLRSVVIPPEPEPPRESARIVSEDEESVTIAMDNVQWEDANGNPIPDDAPIERRLMLDELRERTCRWPIGSRAPYLFCGDQTKEGSPYCSHHHGMAYTVRRPPTDRNWRPRKKSGLSLRGV